MRIASFLVLSLALFSAACTYDNGDARRVLDSEVPPCPGSAPVVQTGIDTDAQIDVQPGNGAGAYFAYESGGRWQMHTTCELTQNSAPCDWDIIVTPEDGRSISNVVPQDFEKGEDSVAPYPDDPRSYQLLAKTGNDVDGISFDTEPGTAIQVDVFLDGACAL